MEIGNLLEKTPANVTKTVKEDKTQSYAVSDNNSKVLNTGTNTPKYTAINKDGDTLELTAEKKDSVEESGTIVIIDEQS